MTETRHTILIIDDERSTRDGLKLALEDKYNVLLAENAMKGLALIAENDVSVVLTDLRMPGMDGMDFLKTLAAGPKHPLVIMLTAYGSIQTAIEAMKLGAYDYISKPVDLDNLEMMVERGIATLEPKKDAAKDAHSSVMDNIVAVSQDMKDVMKKVELSASSTATVLLTGESGTGKEVIARALHAFSERADKPFVPVHCAALNQNLLESELFGHEKGAFTGAAARSLGRFETVGDGTLFLDEIGEISMPTQVKLLRVLENRTFERVGGSEQIPMKARLIAATNRNLAAMVKEGTFREDLFYRLNVVTIEIPPLRKRKDDIPPLLDFFLKRNGDAKARNIVAFSNEAVNLLTAYDWPGNVRELRNCVERMTVFSRGPVLTLGDVPAEIRQSIAMQFEQEKNAPAEAAVQTDTLDVKSNEKALILKALEDCNGNRSHAAERLNISRRTLQRKLREYGIQ